MNEAVNSPRTWAALAAALALHALLLAVPLKRPSPPAQISTIELELTTLLPPPDARIEPAPEPAAPVEPAPEQPQRLAETASPESPPAPAVPEPQRQPTAQRRSRANTDVILSRQFISEKPVIDRIFGRPIEAVATPRVDFRIPERIAAAPVGQGR